MPNELFSFEKTFPIDNMGYLNKAFHEAFHHYIKVVGTQVSSSSSDTYAYQMVHSAQIMQVPSIATHIPCMYFICSVIVYATKPSS